MASGVLVLLVAVISQIPASKQVTGNAPAIVDFVQQRLHSVLKESIHADADHSTLEIHIEQLNPEQLQVEVLDTSTTPALMLLRQTIETTGGDLQLRTWMLLKSTVQRWMRNVTPTTKEAPHAHTQKASTSTPQPPTPQPSKKLPHADSEPNHHPTTGEHHLDVERSHHTPNRTYFAATAELALETPEFLAPGVGAEAGMRLGNSNITLVGHIGYRYAPRFSVHQIPVAGYLMWSGGKPAQFGLGLVVGSELRFARAPIKRLHSKGPDIDFGAFVQAGSTVYNTLSWFARFYLLMRGAPHTFLKGTRQGEEHMLRGILAVGTQWQ